MTTTEVLMVLQIIIIALAALAIGWQLYQLRRTLQASACQDIVQKFTALVGSPEFPKVFSFGRGGKQMGEEEKKKAALCSAALAFLEQTYVQSSAGQLADRLTGPWVEFVKHWLNQDEIKAYWGSEAMVCPKDGFDAGFCKFVDDTYGAA